MSQDHYAASPLTLHTLIESIEVNDKRLQNIVEALVKHIINKRNMMQAITPQSAPSASTSTLPADIEVASGLPSSNRRQRLLDAMNQQASTAAEPLSLRRTNTMGRGFTLSDGQQNNGSLDVDMLARLRESQRTRERIILERRARRNESRTNEQSTDTEPSRSTASNLIPILQRRPHDSDDEMRSVQIRREADRIRSDHPELAESLQDAQIFQEARQEILRREILEFGVSSAQTVRRTNASRDNTWAEEIGRLIHRPSEATRSRRDADVAGIRPHSDTLSAAALRYLSPTSSLSDANANANAGEADRSAQSPEPFLDMDSAAFRPLPTDRRASPLTSSSPEFLATLPPAQHISPIQIERPLQHSQVNRSASNASTSRTLLTRTNTIRRPSHRMRPRSPRYSASDSTSSMLRNILDLPAPPDVSEFLSRGADEEVPIEPEGPFTDFQNWTTRRRQIARAEREASSLDVLPRSATSRSIDLEAEILGSSSSVAALAEREVIHQMVRDAMDTEESDLEDRLNILWPQAGTRLDDYVPLLDEDRQMEEAPVSNARRVVSRNPSPHL